MPTLIVSWDKRRDRESPLRLQAAFCVYESVLCSPNMQKRVKYPACLPWHVQVNSTLCSDMQYKLQCCLLYFTIFCSRSFRSLAMCLMLDNICFLIITQYCVRTKSGKVRSWNSSRVKVKILSILIKVKNEIIFSTYFRYFPAFFVISKFRKTFFSHLYCETAMTFLSPHSSVAIPISQK